MCCGRHYYRRKNGQSNNGPENKQHNAGKACYRRSLREIQSATIAVKLLWSGDLVQHGKHQAEDRDNTQRIELQPLGAGFGVRGFTSWAIHIARETFTSLREIGETRTAFCERCPNPLGFRTTLRTTG